ncbi:GTP 3',8-cyclase MoaA [Algoriphagus halophytocola]|uniref:GTP 3',8-cyclase n=1 Tax=Algoriphagus halophytocola TaxID=2991499 RepID=A0ABY6MEX4_9BACT|nr:MULTISPECIES: GTP 3',8-cyclase MoaA [unclassified Algoriphagus]UZD21490.1 GTP 3',8-cyclase MoaA [Algoriphagus sp. TR-M5]WBL42702.1 GTP 3',8-cyclase MoaA [Algoriphagus sp. TR-M9]
MTQSGNIQELRDRFGRVHNYLRISLIEKCNLRCSYCMPAEGIALSPKATIMSAEEVLEFARIFVGLGVDKIRLTGGEPLLRKDISVILEGLSRMPVEISITTNGLLIDRHVDNLKKFGVKKINFSLDTLKESRFQEITRRSGFQKTLDNFELLQEDFDLKINAVLIKGTNEDEIVDFVNLTRDYEVSVRFIEFMPFDGNRWDRSKMVSEQEILDHLSARFGSAQIASLPNEKNFTARKFQVAGYKGTFGIISSVTNPFCGTCNRIRLTANGRIKNCLFSNHEIDLLSAMRAGEDVEKLILESILNKKALRAGMDSMEKLSDPALHSDNRSMIAIGG